MVFNSAVTYKIEYPVNNSPSSLTFVVEAEEQVNAAGALQSLKLQAYFQRASLTSVTKHPFISHYILELDSPITLVDFAVILTLVDEYLDRYQLPLLRDKANINKEVKNSSLWAPFIAMEPEVVSTEFKDFLDNIENNSSAFVVIPDLTDTNPGTNSTWSYIQSVNLAFEYDVRKEKWTYEGFIGNLGDSGTAFPYEGQLKELAGSSLTDCIKEWLNLNDPLFKATPPINWKIMVTIAAFVNLDDFEEGTQVLITAAHIGIHHAWKAAPQYIQDMSRYVKGTYPAEELKKSGVALNIIPVKAAILMEEYWQALVEDRHNYENSSALLVVNYPISTQVSGDSHILRQVIGTKVSITPF